MTTNAPLVKEIEIDLHKYWLVLKRRWLLIATVCGLTTALSAVAAHQQSPEYQAELKLLFESNRQDALVGLEETTELRAVTKQANPLDTQVEIIRSIPTAQIAIQRLKLKDIEGELLDPVEFLETLKVRSVPGTDIISVNYVSPDPELSAAVVNTIADVYIQGNVQSNRASAISAKRFIETQLPQSDAAVSQAEAALRSFKESNGIVDLDSESKNTVSSLSNIQNWSTEVSASLAGVSAKMGELQGQLGLTPRQAYAVGLVSESPGVQVLMTQLQALQSDLTIARTRYEESHPEIVNLSAQAEDLYALLEQRVGVALGDNQAFLPVDDLQAGSLEQGLIERYLTLAAERSSLEQRLNQIERSRQNTQARAQILPQLEQQQRELERELTAAQTTYETLLENFQQAQVLENKRNGTARVISPALIPEESIAPSMKLYLLAGGVLGALLGVMLAFLSDLIDRSAKTVHEGQAVYDYPLMGVIPAWAKLRPSARSIDLEVPQLVVQKPQPVPVVEAYQALQANLKFACLDRPLKTIAVTSALAGEGKSEVTANLALTLAQLGHRVLVVDADLRLPTQHHIWDISEQQGLTNFAVGQLPLKNAIVIKAPNLHVLPAGSIPPNPLAILESKQVSALLRACEKAYDYIIVDTPALLGLADTLTIGRLADGLLVVMQPGRADVDSITAAKSMLAQSNQNILGLVANGVTVHNKADRYFYHRQEAYLADNADENLPELLPREMAASGQASRRS
ncbi:MAG: polysaccharide biosynthesis tyrosine autokinase [Cyanobacteria bacterium J06643_4]